ncbi:MAG: hypothetical protein M0R46_10030 [Candidatus Muirbacterium halophilum]|nr:hypothetical protein [Candidatus Muirbacterium halophilum]
MMKILKGNWLILLVLLSAFSFGAGDYEDIITQNEEATKAAGELGASWIKLLIAWTPMIAVFVATFAVYSYETKKAKQEQEDSKIKIFFIWAAAVFVITVLLGAGMGLLTSFLAGDFALASQIMQDYWAGLLK